LRWLDDALHTKNRARAARLGPDLTPASVFTTRKGKSTPEWSPRLDHGFSQILDCGLADTCRTRVDELDPAKSADLREARRLLRAGLDALDKLSIADWNPEILELRASLQKRLDCLPARRDRPPRALHHHPPDWHRPNG
jgi:hypothetical protein